MTKSLATPIVGHFLEASDEYRQTIGNKCINLMKGHSMAFEQH